jgi:translation initiation factor 6 (eIF-6)
MMGQAILEKRTYDQRIFDINCAALLDTSETISSVTSVTADAGALTFGTPIVNTVAVTYSDGTTAAIGKVIQVRISAGTIPTGQPNVVCTVRAKFVTNINPAMEATVLLRLNDTPES